MVRTGRRATALRELLVAAGWRPSAAPAPPRVTLLPPARREAIVDLYAVLGGRADPASLRPGSWDLAFEAGVVVELDEELHFNRYRLATLVPRWTEQLPWRSRYTTFCTERESECLAAGRWGRRWTNPSCEGHFGAPDPPGQLVPAGSPRWKQRALYDAIKDAAGIAGSGRPGRSCGDP